MRRQGPGGCDSAGDTGDRTDPMELREGKVPRGKFKREKLGERAVKVLSSGEHSIF